jgi:integrase/recombinase XerD
MEQYLTRFLESLAANKGYSDNTVAAYLNDLTQFGEFLQTRPQGSMPDPVECTNAILREYLAEMERRGYASATIARKVAAVKSFFHFLMAQGAVTSDPTLGLAAPKIEKRVPRILSRPEVERLLLMPNQTVGPKSQRDRALLELLYATGLRVSELVMLQVEDLDLDKALVRCQNKNGKARHIPINSESALTALRDYLLRSRPGLAKASNQTALFLNHRGEKLTRQGLWLIIKAYAEAAGISAEVTPHTLRHSFAKHLLGSGTELRQLQELLGHANLSTTLIYDQIGQTEPTEATPND